MKLKTGDKVIVIAGKDKGKEGQITRVLKDSNKVVVEGVNMLKKHQKSRTKGESGQILEIASPVDASNVSIVDPKTGKPSRIAYKVEKGKKTRVAVKSGSEL